MYRYGCIGINTCLFLVFSFTLEGSVLEGNISEGRLLTVCPNSLSFSIVRCRSLYMHACVHVCMHAYIHTYIHAYMHTGYVSSSWTFFHFCAHFSFQLIVVSFQLLYSVLIWSCFALHFKKGSVNA